MSCYIDNTKVILFYSPSRVGVWPLPVEVDVVSSQVVQSGTKQLAHVTVIDGVFVAQSSHVGPKEGEHFADLCVVEQSLRVVANGFLLALQFFGSLNMGMLRYNLLCLSTEAHR
jgi:hypothetical protein